MAQHTKPRDRQSGLLRTAARPASPAWHHLDLPTHGKPPQSVNSSAPSQRTANGDAASRQVRDKFVTDGFKTRLEQSTDARGRDVSGQVTPRGGRRIDIVATADGISAENKVRIDAESKLGRASADTKTVAQVEKDGARLARNVATRELGATVKMIGRVARPVGLVLDAVEVAGAVKADGGKFGSHTQYAAGGLAGGAAGAWAGAEAGAAVGSFAGPVGTVVGGVAGAAIGGIVGSGAGQKTVDWVKSIF